MKEKKIYITLLIILFVFFIVMFSLFGVKNIQSEKDHSTIIVGDRTIWKYEKKRWSIIRNNIAVEDLNWKKYRVFDNQVEKGDFYLWHDDKWYVFDDNKSAVLLEGDLFAYSANYDMNIQPFSVENVDDLSYVKQVLIDHNLSTSSKFTVLSKVLFDFDGDQNQEEFYIVSNAFPSDFEPEYIFSFVFMIKNEQIYMIYDNLDENRFLNGCRPYITSFLDANHDGKYNFILSCGYYSDLGIVDMLYEFSDNQFKILISNQ